MSQFWLAQPLLIFPLKWTSKHEKTTEERSSLFSLGALFWNKRKESVAASCSHHQQQHGEKGILQWEKYISQFHFLSQKLFCIPCWCRVVVKSSSSSSSANNSILSFFISGAHASTKITRVMCTPRYTKWWDACIIAICRKYYGGYSSGEDDGDTVVVAWFAGNCTEQLIFIKARGARAAENVRY